VQFGVFGHQGLLEDDGFLRVEAGGEIVGDDFDGVLRNGAGVGVVGGESVPVGDEVEAVISRQWRVARGAWRGRLHTFAARQYLIL